MQLAPKQNDESLQNIMGEQLRRDSKKDLVLAIADDGDALTEFGDEDALLSVAADAIEVSSNTDTHSSSGPLHSIISGQSLKPSELREQKTQELMPFEDGASSRVSSMKLDFGSLGLVGRDSQIARLRACFDQVRDAETKRKSLSEKDDTKRSKELVLLSGESGCGKTTICSNLEEHMKKSKIGVFVEGKFDMQTSDEPYSGISKALTAMCSKITTSDNVQYHELQKKVMTGLHSEEARLLIHLIPELGSLMPDQDTAEYSTDFEIHEMENGVERLKYSFQLLIRVFCEHLASPLVLLLDDLQWADVSSLQMIDYLMSDVENESPLLIIGCYRSDEVDENSLLFNKILALKDKSSRNDDFQVTEIDVPLFQSEDALAVIKSTMGSVNEEDAKLLAELCIKRTLGNPYFVLEFLKMLYHADLIEYIDNKRIWTWDLARIEDAAMSTANVVVLLQDRMRRMTRQAQVFLRCAAHLGSTFSKATLELIWRSRGSFMSIGGKATLPQLMEMVVKDNYIEAYGPQKFRWVHDKVQEAAFYLLGDANATFQFDIGTSLYYTMDADQLEQDLFTIVDLINSGNKKKRHEFAGVNLRAAEKAMGLSAFKSAASYAGHGIDLIKEKGWSADRKTKLRLYIRGAEAELVLGNVPTAERYIEEVLGQEGFTTLETLPLKMVKLKMMCSIQLRYNDAIDYCLVVLKELGFKVTSSRKLVPLQAFYAVSKIIKKLQSLPKDFATSLGVISDAREKGILAVIAVLNGAAYQAKDNMLSFLATCKTVEMTLKHGVSEYSGESFATIGAAMVVFQYKYETLHHVMELSLAVQDVAGRSGKGKTIHIANMYGLAWTTSLNCIDAMAVGYSIALQTGETEIALANLLFQRVVLPFYLGKPLDQILEDCPKVLARTQEVARKEQELYLRAFYQMILNLSDPSSTHTTKLEGLVLDQGEHKSDDALFRGSIHLAEGDLLLFFADHEAAAKRAIEKGDLYGKLCPSLCLNMCETFHRAIALYDAARRTNQKKYKNAANKLRKRVMGWEKKGNPNCMHMLLLLDAEFAAIQGRTDVAKAKYAEAITVAREHSYLQYEALFSERYADFLFEQLSLADEAELRRTEAIQAYRKWGAHAKVVQMMGGSGDL